MCIVRKRDARSPSKGLSSGASTVRGSSSRRSDPSHDPPTGVVAPGDDNEKFSRHVIPYRAPTRFWKYLYAKRDARTNWASNAGTTRSASATVTGDHWAPAMFEVVFGGRSR